MTSHRLLPKTYILVVDDRTTVTRGPVSAHMLVDAPVTFPTAVHTTTTPKNTRRRKIMGQKLGVTALIKPIYTPLSIKMKRVKLPCIQNS